MTTQDKPTLPWPGADEKRVVNEMIRDNSSGHWHECSEFVRRCVRARAKNLSQEDRVDIAQDVMTRIHKSLPTFRFESKLPTWIVSVTVNRIRDVYRKANAHPEQSTISLDDPRTADDLDLPVTALFENVEDTIIQQDEINRGLDAIEKYVATHANSERNRKILDMVIKEGRTLQDAATAVDCSAPVAGYVVREAQRFARERRNG
jgi:RNA polymerase sigma factor (sigma-70 family)